MNKKSLNTTIPEHIIYTRYPVEGKIAYAAWQVGWLPSIQLVE